MKKIIYFLIIIFSAIKSNAQSDTISEVNIIIKSGEIDWANLNLDELPVEASWTFHTDKISNTLYVDFGALGGNFSKLLLKNQDNITVLIDDRLFEIPDNSIYEISLNKFDKGSYVLELYSHLSVIKENILVQ
jgi:hypothetical protein